MLKNLFKAVVLLMFLLAVSLQASEELVFWNFWDTKFILPVIEQFEKENPGIKIRNEQISWNNGLDKIVVAMANGRAPDICEFGSTWMGRFMAEGALLDVTDDFSDLKPEYMMWEPATFNGRLYGLPWLTGTRVMFYNRALFRKAGLDADKGPETWQELMAAAEKIHDPADGVFGFGMNAGEGHILYKKFMPFVWGNFGQIIDENGKFVFDSVQTRAALDFYLNLKRFSYCEKQDLLDEAFKQGKLGLAISGLWNFARYPVDAPKLDFGVALMPKPSKTHGFSTSFLGGQVLALFKNCRNPAMAAKFIRFLASAENTLPITRGALVSFPAHREAFSDELFKSDGRISVFAEQMKTAIHPPVHRLWIEIEKIINETVEKAMYGHSVDVVMNQANREFAVVESRFAQSDLAKEKAEQHSAFSGLSLFVLSVVSLFALGFAAMLAFIAGEKADSSVENRLMLRNVSFKGQKTLLFLSPWLITFAVFWLYPLLFSLILSFSHYDVFQPEVFSSAGLKNYTRLFTDSGFRQSFLNTLLFVVCTTPVMAGMALVLALMVNNLRRGSAVFRSVFFLPSIISIVVTATIFKSFYSPVGMLNRVIAVMGFTGRAWLIEKNLALPAVMLMNVWAFTGYYMVLYLAALKAVPRQLYEAAEVDGASDWQQFRYVTLPQIHYMTIFIFTVNTIRSWQVFPEIFTLTRGGPVGSTNTLVHHLYETAFRYHEMGYASAVSFVLLAVILVFSVVQMLILQRKTSR